MWLLYLIIAVIFAYGIFIDGPKTRREMAQQEKEFYARHYNKGALAGRDWAEENGIHDPDECGGKSDAFLQGCIDYAESVKSEQEEDD
jgi:hypothetical protein